MAMPAKPLLMRLSPAWMAKAIAPRLLSADDEMCWLWDGSHVRDGYAVVFLAGNNVRVSRVIRTWVDGRDVPANLVIRHSCDNRGCVNPSHLLIGTQAENITDRDIRGRNFESNKTHCPAGHEYNSANTLTRKTRASRECAQCARDRANAYYRANRERVLAEARVRYETDAVFREAAKARARQQRSS